MSCISGSGKKNTEAETFRSLCLSIKQKEKAACLCKGGLPRLWVRGRAPKAEKEPVKGDRKQNMEQDHYDIVVNYIIANQKKFYRLAYTYVRNENDALDIVQNAICSALEHYESIREISYIITWFYRVLVHESLNYVKKRSREIVSDELLCSETAYEEPGYGETEVFFEELDRLPADTQNVIRLRFYEEMSLQEIAEVMELSVNTVKSKLYRGLKSLKEELVI